MRFKLLMLLAAFAFVQIGVNADITKKRNRKGKNKTEQVADSTSAKKKKKNDFAEATKGATYQTGVFDFWLNKKGELLVEVKPRNLENLYLLANRVSEISNNSNFMAGEMIKDPFMFRFSADTTNIYMHTVQSTETVDKDDPIAISFKRNIQDPILKTFKIKAKKGDTLLIDMTPYFVSNEKSITPLAQSMRTRETRPGAYDASSSKLKGAKGFEKNMEITSILNYTSDSGPYTVVMRRSIIELPKEPMQARYQDNRVGYFSSRLYTYTSKKDQIKIDELISRWRVEPKDEDLEKYYNGELVEPKKQIVYYVDNAFPKKWSEVVKKGIEDWNVAFEAAGFKNVVVAKDYPDDPEFDPDDIRFNCIRYAVSDVANAAGPSYTDPRSGEIIVADVLWYHNVISLIHNWRFAQTGAVDKRVRKMVFDDDVMGESLRYVASHEVGHTLGLMHNMGASYAYPVDSLRSPSFTQKYGTTPSIMDYARNNYVAQPGDLEKGVRMTPPLLGVYDIHAINWGYRLFKGCNTPDDEKRELSKVLMAKKNDPMYEFGAQQLFLTEDPTDQTEDLSNDHFRASDYGVKNLKYCIANLNDWFKKENEDYSDINNMYSACLSQYMRYLTHVLPYLGGVEYKDLVQDGSEHYAKRYVSKDKQKKALYWLVNQATSVKWLLPDNIMKTLGIESNLLDNFQYTIAGRILSPATMGSIYEGERSGQKGIYTLDEYLDDTYNAIFAGTIQSKSLSTEEMNLQGATVAALSKFSNLKPAEKSPLGGLTGVNEEFEKMFESALNETGNFCSHKECKAHSDENSYARHNMSTPKLSAAVGRPLLTSTLKKVLVLYKAKRNTGDARTRAFYDYQIIQMEKLFKI